MFLALPEVRALHSGVPFGTGRRLAMTRLVTENSATLFKIQHDNHIKIDYSFVFYKR